MARLVLRTVRTLGVLGLMAVQGAVQAAVELPLEVLGPNGTTVSCTVDLPADLVAGGTINRLWMQIHGLSYANKASVQINNSAWISLNNSTVTVAGPGKSFGGIGGSFATLKLTLAIPAGSLTAGTNTVRFRMNQTDGVSIGFRVLAFNFLTTAGASVLPAGAFTADDPSGWAPPLEGSAAITEGEKLWRTKVLRASSLTTAQLQAKCADCHAQDGRDLKYFNYSNRAIIERSRFHGFTEAEGQKVASYIRSLSVPNPGRPWNPPYQPGPGMDSRPLSAWAAGAGLSAVLNDDLEMLPHLFPGGISKEKVASHETLNMRELPVAIQLPDWNHWLPRTHPKDAWGSGFVADPFHTVFAGASGKPGIRTKLAGSGAAWYVHNGTSSALRHDLDVWLRARANFLLPRTPSSSSSTWTAAYSQKLYSTALWQLVKVWEVMQEFNLEDNGPVIYGPTAEARTWFNGIPFMVAPHKLKIPASSRGIEGSATKTTYFGSAWYHLQIVLDNGNRRHNAHNPVDWGYVYGHLSTLAKYSRYTEPMRLTASLVKAIQNADNGIGPDQPSRGWNPQLMADVGTIVADPWSILWTRVPATTRQQIMQAVLESWLAKARSYQPAAYYAGDLADAGEIPRPHYISTLGGRVMYMIPRFRGSGVDETLLSGIAGWGDTIWPLADWDSLTSSTATIAGVYLFRNP